MCSIFWSFQQLKLAKKPKKRLKFRFLLNQSPNNIAKDITILSNWQKYTQSGHADLAFTFLTGHASVHS